jgi:hypothetical protein
MRKHPDTPLPTPCHPRQPRLRHDTHDRGRLAEDWATKWDSFWQYEANDEGFRQPDPTSDAADARTVHSVVYAVEPS